MRNISIGEKHHGITSAAKINKLLGARPRRLAAARSAGVSCRRRGIASHRWRRKRRRGSAAHRRVGGIIIGSGAQNNRRRRRRSASRIVGIAWQLKRHRRVAASAQLMARRMAK